MKVVLGPDLPQETNSSVRLGEPRAPAGELRRVRNGVALALVLKLLALLLLFFLFSGPGRDPHGAHDAFFQPIVSPNSGV